MKKIFAIILSLLLVLSLNSFSYAYTVDLIVEPQGGGTVTGGGEYQEGTNADIMATPAEGYAFVGWFKEGEDTPFTTNPSYTYEQEADRTYIAKFERGVHVGAIAEPATGGSVSQNGDGSYAENEAVTLTANSNEGYAFIGWFDASSPTVPVSTDNAYTFTPTQDASYIARFSPEYRVDINVTPQEGGSVIGAGQYAGGSIVVLEAVPNEDYRFIGWVSPAEPDTFLSTDIKYTFNLDENLTLSATFGPSYGYIWIRIGIIAGIGGGIFIAVLIILKRRQIASRPKRRGYQVAGRPASATRHNNTGNRPPNRPTGNRPPSRPNGNRPQNRPTDKGSNGNKPQNRPPRY